MVDALAPMSAVSPGGAGFDNRDPAERRILYHPFWDTIRIPVGASGEIRMFQSSEGNRRKTNLLQGGSVNAYESFLITKLLLIPAIGTDIVDLIEFFNVTRYDVTIQRSVAYELLALLTPSGVGGFPGSGIPHYGEAAPAKSAGLGQFTLAGQVAIDVTMKFARRLRNHNEIELNMVFQGLVDQPA